MITVYMETLVRTIESRFHGVARSMISLERPFQATTRCMEASRGGTHLGSHCCNGVLKYRSKPSEPETMSFFSRKKATHTEPNRGQESMASQNPNARTHHGELFADVHLHIADSTSDLPDGAVQRERPSLDNTRQHGPAHGKK